MQLGPTEKAHFECDGCGAQPSGPAPAGWFNRPLDPPAYTGPRHLLFCPVCFSSLPAGQRRLWRRRRLAGRRLATAVKRWFHLPHNPRRGPVA